MEDYSGFFSDLGGSILTSRSLLYGADSRESVDGRRGVAAYAEECEQFLPVTEKVASNATLTHVYTHIYTHTHAHAYTRTHIYTTHNTHTRSCC